MVWLLPGLYRTLVFKLENYQHEAVDYYIHYLEVLGSVYVSDWNILWLSSVAF